MVDIGIAELSKNPAILDKLDSIATIVNKKNKEVKGYFIPKSYDEYLKSLLEEMEYKKFLKRNKELISVEEDDTLLDGLDDEY